MHVVIGWYPLYFYSLKDSWQYSAKQFNPMAAAYMKIIDAAGRCNMFCPVMISMADINTVGARSDEEKYRFGNAIDNLRQRALSKGIFVKTSTDINTVGALSD